MRLQSAEKKQADLQAKMDELKPKALAAFDGDATKDKMLFGTWVSRNYPNFDSLNSELQQAASARDSAMIEVYGVGAEELQRKRNILKKSRDKDVFQPGYVLILLYFETTTNVAPDATCRSLISKLTRLKEQLWTKMPFHNSSHCTPSTKASAMLSSSGLPTRPLTQDQPSLSLLASIPPRAPPSHGKTLDSPRQVPQSARAIGSSVPRPRSIMLRKKSISRSSS